MSDNIPRLKKWTEVTFGKGLFASYNALHNCNCAE